jgi:glycosyltransferase involved in cell wall biosynthesis
MSPNLPLLLWRSRRAWGKVRLALDLAVHQGPWALVDRIRRSLAYRLGTRPETPAPALAAGAPQGTRFDVIYVVGYQHGEPKRYRVFNPAASLDARGYALQILPFERLGEIERRRWTAVALVLFRAEAEPHSGIDSLLNYARGRDMKIVYDIDDLVFDPSLADRIDALGLMSPYLQGVYRRSLENRRRLLLAADLVTVPTAALARVVTGMGREAAVLPNGLNPEQLGIAAGIAADPPTPNAAPVIGYFSGSATHRRDFAECAAALQGTLRRHPDVRLRIVGPLDLDPAWAEFTRRIERIGLLPPGEMLRRMAEIDINLAPLEIGNPFCEAKSELKFFEAALLGIPTIASATESFRTAIEDGVSGFVVADTAGWTRALDLLVTDPELRRRMGAAARERALSRHGVEPLTDRAITVLGLSAPAPLASRPRSV